MKKPVRKNLQRLYVKICNRIIVLKKQLFSRWVAFLLISFQLPGSGNQAYDRLITIFYRTLCAWRYALFQYFSFKDEMMTPLEVEAWMNFTSPSGPISWTIPT